MRLPRLLLLTLVLLAAAATPTRADWDNFVPEESPIVGGYSDPDSIKARMDEAPLHHIEGLWRYAGGQALVAIERCGVEAQAPGAACIYRIVIVDSPRKAVGPGTVLGYATASGTRDTYNARLYTSRLRSLIGSPSRFTLRLDADDSHIAVTPVKSGWRLMVRQSLHFLVRAGLYHDPQAGGEPDGFTRVYPASTGRPAEPIYL